MVELNVGGMSNVWFENNFNFPVYIPLGIARAEDENRFYAL